MSNRRILTAILAAALVASGGVQATAKSSTLGKALAIGGAAAIIYCGTHPEKCGAKPKPAAAAPAPTAAPQPSAPAPSPYTSQELQQNREMQAALNDMGYGAGPVDGRPGPQTRSAVSAYQNDMGMRPTGTLNDQDRNDLINWSQRAKVAVQADPRYAQVFANEGWPGVLRAERQQQYTGMAPGQAATPTPASTPPTPTDQGNTPPTPVINAGPQPTQASVATFCIQTNALTAANGAPQTAQTMTDPKLALDEQFCQGESAAVSRSTSLMQRVENASEDQMAGYCSSIFDEAPYPAMIAALPKTGVNQIVAMAQKAAQSPSQALAAVATSPDTAEMIGQLCGGLAYKRDEPATALAANLYLVGLGKDAYAEYVGEQLSRGLGVASAPAAGQAWISYAADKLQAGATPAFFPETNREHIAILKAAVAGGGGAAPSQPAGGSSAGFVPKFGAGGN